MNYCRTVERQKNGTNVGEWILMGRMMHGGVERGFKTEEETEPFR